MRPDTPAQYQPAQKRERSRIVGLCPAAFAFLGIFFASAGWPWLAAGLVALGLPPIVGSALWQFALLRRLADETHQRRLSPQDWITAARVTLLFGALPLIGWCSGAYLAGMITHSSSAAVLYLALLSATLAPCLVAGGLGYFIARRRHRGE
jgi:hypothetical protein